MGVGEMISYLDTNVVIWLEAGLIDRLSEKAKQRIETSDLLISPMVLLELEFLNEVGKLKTRPDPVLSHLGQEIGLSVCQLPMASTVAAALDLHWTRDPFDRMIVANAVANNMASLITSDKLILQIYPNSIW
jgi:PIN domain nuclease of toxin-antitoxin system